MSALAALLALGLAATPMARLESLGPKPPAHPSRVVTLAPSLTETVLALGAGDRLVGVSRYDELPQVKSLPRVGGYLDPSVEAVISLHPDLVLVQPSPANERPVKLIAELGVPVLSLPMQGIDGALEGIRAIGKVLGLAEKGEAIAKRIADTRAAIRKKAAALRHPRVLFVYGFEPLVVAGPGSFADALLKDAGGINVAAQASSPYPTYSVEQAVVDRPDVVIDASHAGGGERLKELLPKARFVPLASQDLLHPGPRLEEGLRELFAILHP